MSARRVYLLDTNVISETRKLRPEARVMRFLDKAEPEELRLSVLTLGELRKGVETRRRVDASGATLLARWVDELEMRFARQTVPIDGRVARLWGEWSAVRSRPVVDTLLAATAAVHGLTLVTRNEKDVADLPVEWMNPWM